MAERRSFDLHRRTSRLTLTLTTALAAVVFFFGAMLAVDPGPSRRTRGVPASEKSQGRTLRGAFHIHTTRSDGALDKRTIAAAAGRAGMAFAIFTDHGDSTRPPDPPVYIGEVLCIDAVEISTSDGHYIALGLPGAAPYPLGGHADAVAEDVRRLGGFGVAAHPYSPRPELAWSDWSVAVDGLEWLNADSEWRDEGRLRLARGLLAYAWRPAGALASLLDRPPAALETWDRLGRTRRVVGLAAQDAHGGFGTETNGSRGRRVHVPSYDASFRMFSTYVKLRDLPAPPDASAAASDDSTARITAARDADAIINAIRAGSVFTAIDALAAPASLDFTARAADRTAEMGEVLPIEAGPARFSVRAAVPAGATTTLLLDGRAIARAGGGVLDHDAALPGVYRVEIHVAGAPGVPPVPWLVSNPIYRWAEPRPETPSPAPAADISAQPLEAGEWTTEASPSSAAIPEQKEGSAALRFQLAPGPRASQFAALSARLAGVPEGKTMVLFRGRASRPMRVSVQLRFGDRAEARWGSSVYLDTAERDIRIPLERLRPEGASGARPSLGEATSLLFVVDLTNAAPGADGQFTISDVRFGRPEP